MPESHVLFINKGADSTNLTRSVGAERTEIFKHVQRREHPRERRKSRRRFSQKLDEREEHALPNLAPAPAHRHDRLSQSHPTRNEASPPSIQQLNSYATVRWQLFCKFYDSHSLDSPSPEYDFARNKSFLKVLLSTSISSAMVNSAIDAIIFGNAACAFGSVECRRSSLMAYGHALKLLGSAIQRQNISRNETLLTVLLLMLMDKRLLEPNQVLPTWVVHLSGALRLFARRGCSDLDAFGTLNAAMTRTILVNAMWIGIAQRKPLADITLRTSTEDDARQGREKLLKIHDFRIVFESLPRLLHDVDRLLEDVNTCNADRLAQYCKKLHMLRRHTDTTLWAMHPPESISILYSDDFSPAIEEHCFIHASTTFPIAFRFNRGHGPLLFAKLAVIALIIDCTLLHIFHVRPTVPSSDGVSSKCTVEEHAFAKAEDLCKSIYSLCLYESLACADFIAVILQLTENFFQERRAWKEMEWCRGCSTANKIRTQRLKMQHPTLCKVGDLVDSIGAIGRYRVQPINWWHDGHHRTP